MKVRASLFFVVTVMALVLAGCFSKVSVPEYGTLKGHIQESPDNDVTKLTVSLGNKQTNPKADGSFEIAELEIGTYEFSVSDGDQVLYSATVELDAGDNVIELVFGGELAVPNSGFEEPVDGNDVPGWKAGWHYGNGGPVLSRAFFELSDEVKHSGQYSLKMDGTSSYGTEKIATHIALPAIPGFFYTASVSFYPEDEVKWPHPYMVLGFFDETGDRIHHKSALSSSSGTPDEWERITVTEAAPEGAVAVGVILVGNTGYVNVSYWDDVKIEVSRPQGE